MLQFLRRQTLREKLALQGFDVSFEDGEGIAQVVGNGSLQETLVLNGPPGLAVVLIQGLAHPFKHQTKLAQLIFTGAFDLEVKVVFLDAANGTRQDADRWGDLFALEPPCAQNDACRRVEKGKNSHGGLGAAI